MKVLSGRSQVSLSKEIAHTLGAQYIESKIDEFSDKELRIQIQESVFGDDVIVVQSTCKPANDHLMELLLLIDTAKRAGANRIIGVIPYFGYSRQDRPCYNYGPISASLIVTLLEAAGIKHIITVDLHSKQLEGFFKISIQNLDASGLFSQLFDKDSNQVVISPDVGGLSRAKQFSECLKINLAVINKSRDENRKCHMSDIIGNVEGKDCIILDDIVDSGTTLCQAADLLALRGAKSIDACITHGVLSGKAREYLQNSVIERIFITNTIENYRLPPKFQVISAADIICDALKRLKRKSD